MSLYYYALIEFLDKYQNRYKWIMPDKVRNIFYQGKSYAYYESYKNTMNLLKEHNYTEYYEYIYEIINKVTGKPLNLTTKQEIKTREMFEKISKVKTTRLLRAYVLYKCMELQLINTSYYEKIYLGKYITKNITKYDKKWKIICDKLNWIYIPSLQEYDENKYDMPVDVKEKFIKEFGEDVSRPRLSYAQRVFIDRIGTKDENGHRYAVSWTVGGYPLASKIHKDNKFVYTLIEDRSNPEGRYSAYHGCFDKRYID